jgi:hypothetical protein
LRWENPAMLCHTLNRGGWRGLILRGNQAHATGPPSL